MEKYKNWLDEPIDLDDIYGKPTGKELKYEVAAVVCFVIFAVVVIVGYL